MVAHSGSFVAVQEGLKQSSEEKRKEGDDERGWPEFDLDRDSPTIAFLNLASQMPGKMRVAHAPWVNHGWHVALNPQGAGLETAATASGDGRTFTLALDLCRHGLAFKISDGVSYFAPFAETMTIADLHRDFIAMLDRHGLPSTFDGRPNEIPDSVPFSKNTQPRQYRRESASRFRDISSADT